MSRIREATHGNLALGGAQVQEDVDAALGRRATRGQAGRPRRGDDVGEDQFGLL